MNLDKHVQSKFIAKGSCILEYSLRFKINEALFGIKVFHRKNEGNKNIGKEDEQGV